ncbi:MAG: hypothetical protein JWO53_891, partial [Chlamydiia bacterium]|nr:hypothetical protein [Chlamydiia bacterium]
QKHLAFLDLHSVVSIALSIQGIFLSREVVLMVLPLLKSVVQFFVRVLQEPVYVRSLLQHYLLLFRAGGVSKILLLFRKYKELT